MRLGLYIPVLDDQPAGVGVYIEEVCSRLIRRLPECVVFSGTPQVRRPWLEGVEVVGLGADRWPSLPYATGLRRRARRLTWLASWVARDLRRHGVEVLFSPVQEGPLVGATPAVLVMHDLTALRYPAGYDAGTVAQTRWLLPRMLRHATRVVAVSQNTRRDVLETFGLDPHRVEVIGEGCDREIFRPRPASEARATAARYGLTGRYLLYAGTFSRHKNVGLVLEALAMLGPAYGDLHLALAGRNDVGAAGELRRQVQRLGLGARVHELGYVPRTDLASLMSGAASFVYPSRYEGFGLAPLEAMACGVPVVASEVASLPEVVGTGGLLVPTADAGAWARALEQVLARDAAEARDAAVRQAARFDWETAVSSLHESLSAAAATRRSAAASPALRQAP